VTMRVSDVYLHIFRMRSESKTNHCRCELEFESLHFPFRGAIATLTYLVSSLCLRRPLRPPHVSRPFTPLRRRSTPLPRPCLPLCLSAAFPSRQRHTHSKLVARHPRQARSADAARARSGLYSVRRVGAAESRPRHSGACAGGGKGVTTDTERRRECASKNNQPTQVRVFPHKICIFSANIVKTHSARSSIRSIVLPCIEIMWKTPSLNALLWYCP
jgi:hypothetical protein